MSGLGEQMLVDMYGCDRDTLDNEATIRACMLEGARRCGVTIVGECFHRYQPQGISGVVVIAESHLAIHTWPEHGYVAVDLFTCGGTLNPEACFSYLREAFRCQHHTMSTTSRGRSFESRSGGQGEMPSWPHRHVELVGPGRTLLLKLNGPWLFEGEEHFPALGDMRALVQIGDFVELGRGLVLNGSVQLTEAVDSMYTTALVFPAALIAPTRRHWLIIGGGDGATARESLRFRDTESVRLVDISRLVIERTQELIPSFWGGCQHDSRLRIETSDAGAVVRAMVARGEQVDIIVYDLSDPGNEETQPFSESSADHLYSEEALHLVGRCLRPGGVFAAQLAELSPLRFEDHRRARQILQKVFRHVYSYGTFIEPFGYTESFVVASNHDGPWNPAEWQSVDKRLARIYDGNHAAAYSGRWHQHLFALPPHVARRLV